MERNSCYNSEKKNLVEFIKNKSTNPPLACIILA